MAATTIVWFRNCLRLHDNIPLVEASKVSQNIVCLFVFTPSVYDRKYMGINRFYFLLESLKDLKKQLRDQFNGDLMILETKRTYEYVFAQLSREFKIDNIFYEYDSAPFAKKRDQSIRDYLKANHPAIRFASFPGHTLTDLAKVTCKPGFKNPINMNMVEFILLEQFGQRKGGSGINVKTPIDPPKTLQFDMRFHEHIANCNDLWLLKDVPEIDEVQNIFGNVFVDLKSEVVENSYFKGGETEGLQRLQQKVLENADYACKFKKPETSSITTANSNFREPSTTGLSPYLALGCLSVRAFWSAIDKAFEKMKNPKIDSLAMSLYGQLLFREMFYIHSESIGYGYAKNDKIQNPVITKFVDWDDHNSALIKAWEDGKTGYPYIDALMRQMKVTGWMHHLGRHAVSCFFTRGQMYQNWTFGRDVFDRLLVDSDYALNNGNWLWLSGIASYSMPFFRVYNPCPQEEKKSALNFDNGGNDFIRYWVPELKNFPAKYLTSPWDCPRLAQESCGIIIGKDYPNPIVPIKNTNMEKFKKSLSENKANSEAQIKANVKSKLKRMRDE